MRRSYISPEFEQSRVFGTFNMLESSTLFASKMLEIEDEIFLNEQSVVYYQNTQSEQIDVSVETSTEPITYKLIDDKFNTSELIIDPSQNDFQRNTKTKWILTIKLRTLLTNYIFALLKENRTFEGIKNNMTSRNSVDTAIREYISKNVLNRYKVENISLFLKYNDLRRQVALRYKNKWSNNPTEISSSLYKVSKIETQTAFDYTSLKVLFSQERNSDLFNFDYYYTIYWSKI